EHSVVLGFRAVAPDNLVRLRQARGFLNPLFEWCGPLVPGRRGRGTFVGQRAGPVAALCINALYQKSLGHDSANCKYGCAGVINSGLLGNYHSWRSACIGSTRLARCAGMKEASTPASKKPR